MHEHHAGSYYLRARGGGHAAVFGMCDPYLKVVPSRVVCDCDSCRVFTRSCLAGLASSRIFEEVYCFFPQPKVKLNQQQKVGKTPTFHPDDAPATACAFAPLAVAAAFATRAVAAAPSQHPCR